jgi:LmbE family N-acetylglucosaminyl deacetylase
MYCGDAALGYQLMTRRTLLALPAALAAGAQPRKQKIVVVGGHPDDPETGCGGTMAKYADAGHEVVSLYLTRGEAGIAGRTHSEAAAIRTREAQAACKVLRARPVFAGQIDGATEVNAERYEQFRKLLMAERPDVVLAQWPVDTHRDHRAGSLLVLDCLGSNPRAFSLYFYEVMTGSQTQTFHPTHYVDISPTEKRKRDACFAHASQKPEEFYPVHAKMNEFRGMEAGVRYAEAFVHHAPCPMVPLP